jgi:hypothetical protein
MFAGLAVLIAAVSGFLPDLQAARTTANAAADRANLQWLYAALSAHRQELLGAEAAGGHRLLLQLWTRGLVDRSPGNLDRFFVPGRRDADSHYLDLRERVLRGEEIWTDLAATDSRDTHYAALAAPNLDRLFAPDQPIAADDEDDGASSPRAPHVIRVLYGDGSIRDLELQAPPVFGPASPTPALQQLER